MNDCYGKGVQKCETVPFSEGPYIGCLIAAIYHFQELGLQPEDGFVLKIVQLEELIHVRHSIFVIGNAGTGK